MHARPSRSLAYLIGATTTIFLTATSALEIAEAPLCGMTVSVAASSTRQTDDAVIYHAGFSSQDWSGRLWSRPVRGDGSIGAPLWDAAALIPPADSRRLFTCDPAVRNGCGKPFAWDSLSAQQKTALNQNDSGQPDNKGFLRLQYLRGDRSNEAPNGEQFRRRSTVLGDIINSDPTFVGKPDHGFDVLPGAERASYAAYRQDPAYRSRPDMVYIGANDGMLHAFDAATGVERFAFVPNAVFERLARLTSSRYNQNHRYLVDGSQRVLDAYIDGAWQTILIGSLGAGGRGVYALRVSDPENFDEADVLWEFSSANDPDLGFSIPQPSIARMNNGSWAAIISNGYNSANQRSVLFILDLQTGSVIKKIDTQASGHNGLSSPIPVDIDADRIADVIYAGDLNGNLWKFDVTGRTAKDWDVAFSQAGKPAPLYSACATENQCDPNTRQAITARPEVGLNPNGGLIVYFGTGRYLASGDEAAMSPVNSFYGIFDRNERQTKRPEPVGEGRRSLLRQQVLATQQYSQGPLPRLLRVTGSARTSENHAGWYLDLPESGERQLSPPRLRGGRIAFTTAVPDPEACDAGSTGWLMELDAFSGSRLPFSPFDLNLDRRFNALDFVSVTVDEQTLSLPASGLRSMVGVVKTPAAINAGGIEYNYAGSVNGEVDLMIGNGVGIQGRQSWRQLR